MDGDRQWHGRAVRILASGLPGRGRRIEDPLWTRQGNRTKLLVESGRTGDGGWIGVPYGSVARLILLYLQTEAIRTSNPEVELGRSMRSWMTRMSLASGGRNYQLVAEQARRISACRLTFLIVRPPGDLYFIELRAQTGKLRFLPAMP